METKGLLEPETLSEQIINKLVHDFISRYELKQQFRLNQFNSDSNQLQAELILYHRSMHQLSSLSLYKVHSLQKALQDVLFKLFQFFVRFFNKHFPQQSTYTKQLNPYDNRCLECSSNTNAKRIQSVKRDLLDCIPMLSKKDMEQNGQQKTPLDFDPDILTEEIVLEKMVKLQRNLNEKQQGLIRCIDEFEDFRVNLMMGRPKYSDKELQDKFKAKQYIIQVGSYFSSHLQAIQNKINNMKTHCKPTADFAVQCFCQEQTEAENQARIQLQNSKIATLKNQAEIRRLNQSCHRLEESVKLYSMEVKLLTNKISELDVENHNLKQEVFIEKLKVKGKQNKLNQSREQQLKKTKESIKSSAQSVINIDLAHEVLNQMNERKQQIQQSGVKAEDFLPYIRTSFRKVLDNLIVHKRNSVLDKKKGVLLENYQNETQLNKVIQGSSNKKNRGSIRGIASFMVKKQARNGSTFQIQHNNNNNYSSNPIQNSLRLSTRQLSYKIVGVKRNGTRNQSTNKQHSRANSKIDTGSRDRDSKMAYKNSTLLTEGNHLRKRPMHVKLSSLSSDVKEPFNIEHLGHRQAIDELNHSTYENGYNGIAPQCLQGQKSDPRFLKMGTNQHSEWIRKAHHTRSKESNNSLNSFRKGSTLSVLNEQQGSGFRRLKDLIQIRRLSGSKTLSPYVISNFFQPPLSQRYKASSMESNSQANISNQSDQNSGVKSIFNRLKNTGKMKPFQTTIEVWGSPKNNKQKFKKQPLRLQELSFMTSFSTLMARTHLLHQQLYEQMRKCILDSSKENKYSWKDGQEAMVKEIVGQLVTRHRMCKSDKLLCPHLSQFLDAFSSCIE